MQLSMTKNWSKNLNRHWWGIKELGHKQIRRWESVEQWKPRKGWCRSGKKISEP